MAYQNALKILTEHKDGLSKLAEKLLEKEVIFGEDLEAIFGKRPWIKEERILPKKVVIPSVDDEAEVVTENGKAEAADVAESPETSANTEDKLKVGQIKKR